MHRYICHFYLPTRIGNRALHFYEPPQDKAGLWAERIQDAADKSMPQDCGWIVKKAKHGRWGRLPVR